MSLIRNIREISNMGTKIADKKLCDLYTKMVTKLGEEYTRGAFIYIQLFFKDDEKKINDADAEINRIWQECVGGKATLLDFLRALEKYKEVSIKGVTRYKSRHAKTA